MRRDALPNDHWFYPASFYRISDSKDEHIPDIAVQHYCLHVAGVAVKKACVWHIDNANLRGRALNLDAVFAKVDVTVRRQDI